MSGVPLPFSISLLSISFIGLAGNIRFFFGNYKEKKQLLVLMTSLHTVLCLVQMCDISRVFLGITLTRSSCLRFVGAYYASFSFAQSILFSLLGLEVLTLISSPYLYKKLRVWWFHLIIYSTFIFSAWTVYESYISDEERPVLLCIPPTALTRSVNSIRSTFPLLQTTKIIENATVTK
ncbi:hypothetical protein PFISCL1PPCAC_28225 [Pristionchus fissidentatus]|uniref:G protein-coupled receptor n=1 Tax=Pristionchus fissidentatus TaxID=1538716 RepID=A0AAV5X2U0_9BILA|nr:hypothetical protein PFISCL1PPCAC_28225 [Pristionchus fissidentatus]